MQSIAVEVEMSDIEVLPSQPGCFHAELALQQKSIANTKCSGRTFPLESTRRQPVAHPANSAAMLIRPAKEPLLSLT